MTSQDILDADQLLAPLSEENPCGESLRWDPLWDEMRSARESTSNAVDESADTVENWPLVAELTQDALTSRTKDLMIAGWLTESLVRLHGIAGLRDGIRLLRGLVENFWERLYPEIEDGDLEVRAAPLYWLTDADAGSQMPNVLRSVVPLANSNDGEMFSWAYSQSRFVTPQGANEDEGSYNRRVSVGETRKQAFETAVEATPKETYVEIYESIQECRNEIQELGEVLDEKLGDASPGWTAMRKALDEIEGLVKRILNDKGGLPGLETDEDGDEASDESGSSAGGSSGGPSGPIRSRADAIQRLRDASEYFRRTEPHSPVAYLVQRAVSWTGMGFEQVIQDLIKDSSVMGRIEETLGLNNKSDDN
ncbi:MAG: type VI secretion system protein TssA [Planctomycetes bacterium]|nr:type VI secretion system protein TssA [Planctomycetota bacterium]